MSIQGMSRSTWRDASSAEKRCERLGQHSLVSSANLVHANVVHTPPQPPSRAPARCVRSLV